VQWLGYLASGPVSPVQTMYGLSASKARKRARVCMYA
jgi:hypothetical protein